MGLLEDHDKFTYRIYFNKTQTRLYCKCRYCSSSIIYQKRFDDRFQLTKYSDSHKHSLKYFKSRTTYQKMKGLLKTLPNSITSESIKTFICSKLNISALTYTNYARKINNQLSDPRSILQVIKRLEVDHDINSEPMPDSLNGSLP